MMLCCEAAIGPQSCWASGPHDRSLHLAIAAASCLTPASRPQSPASGLQQCSRPEQRLARPGAMGDRHVTLADAGGYPGSPRGACLPGTVSALPLRGLHPPDRTSQACGMPSASRIDAFVSRRGRSPCAAAIAACRRRRLTLPSPSSAHLLRPFLRPCRELPPLRPLKDHLRGPAALRCVFGLQKATGSGRCAGRPAAVHAPFTLAPPNSSLSPCPALPSHCRH